ncbi:Trihelix transcription factor GT-3b [Apostasia shenzhenica]|uniref:Trihelix transcription factor GT-3b n=1 Tax=Apostasia shenzhenica TaxID=1088818 RepID=A0A2I0B451_9ASPA|nr:Trihelix transcription factor GT-3b [Apostasia shenzhenica]
MMMGGGEGDPIGGRMGMVGGFPLQVNPPQATAGEMVGTSGGAVSGGGGGGGGQRGKEEKVAQWGTQETRELIAIRADLERDFTVVRRNKTLWEAVSLRMREKGYRRTADQCKCKWKNLVNRYKGKETADAENGRQCPFFDELQAVFTERARNMQRLLLESESGTPHSKKKLRKLSADRSSDEFSDEEDEDEDDSDEERSTRSRKKKTRTTTDKSRAAVSIQDLLQDFLQQQQRIEANWWAIIDRRAQERQRCELEWRQSMEKMERERLMLEQEWRDREENRRMREESRAEKRDALLTTLLNKLMQDDL